MSRPSRHPARGQRVNPSTSVGLFGPKEGDFELKLELNQLATRLRSETQTDFHGEFDPGSGRTLAARLTHASRATNQPFGAGESGERVSNTWVTCPRLRDNTGKPV